MMQHRFKTTCLDAGKLLDGCYKLSTFMNRLNKLANEQEGNGYGWTADEFKGDGFEALIEVLINCMSADKRIGIRNYAPWTGKDMGIDGVGTTNEVKSRPVTVQIKYRSDVTSELTTADGISNFVAMSTTSDEYRDAHMVYFTTAKGINRAILEQMYNSKPKVFAFKDIKKFIDNNAVFWDTFRAEMGI
jgi:hypothetical protein